MTELYSTYKIRIVHDLQHVYLRPDQGEAREECERRIPHVDLVYLLSLLLKVCMCW